MKKPTPTSLSSHPQAYRICARQFIENRFIPALVLLLLALAGQARAASGTWTNLSNSVWSDPTNWLNGVVADGNGSTADFSTINPLSDITVSLDITRTNTNLIFGDTDPAGSPANWIVDNAGNVANLLELVGATPTITVNQLGPVGFNTNGVTISATIDGTNGLIKTGPGILNFSAPNTYTNGTTINGGVIAISSTTATFGSNVINNPITFNGGAISNNWGANNSININNPIIVPAGQTGTIYMGNRVRLASNGNGATITGGGTLNFVANSTVTRDDIGNQAGAFTGTVNFVGSGGMRFFINAGAFSGFSNALVNLNGAIAWNFNDNSGGNTFTFGALAGTNAAAQIGFTSAGGAPRIAVGLLNTSTTFAGQFVNTAHLVKIGTGTFTLPGTHTHTGTNFVVGGKLVGVTGGSMSNSVSLTVSNNSAFGVLVSPAGNQWVGPGMTNYANSAIELNFAGSVPSTALAPLLIRGNFAPSNTVSINVLGGNWAVGAYPLIKYTGSLLGNGFAALNLASLPSRVQGVLSNDTAANSIDLVVTSTTQPLFWATGSGTWDTTSVNWKDSAAVGTAYQESGGFGDSVLFEDTQSVGSPITVTLNSTVVPVGVNVDASKNYTISGSGTISGFASLTKAGSGTLAVSTINTFTGGANINGGILNFSTLGNLGSSAIKFGGGTLQYASGNSTDISVRTVTFNAGGGTIDSAGNNLTFSNAVGNAGTGGLTKTGAGTLILNGANNYFGNTVVNQGTLSLATGAGISNSAALIVNSGAFLDEAFPGINLNGAVNQILAGNGTVGPTTMPNNTMLTPGTNGVAATLTVNSLTVNGGTIAFDISTNVSGRDQLVVQGNMAITGGTLQLIPSTFLTNGTYRLFHAGDGIAGIGNLLVTGFSQPGQIAFLSDAVFQNIDLIVATGGTNSLVWSGTGSTWDVGSTADWLNGGNPSIFNQGDGVTFDDTGAANPIVSLASAIYPSNVTVTGSASYTLQDGSGVGAGKLVGPTLVNKSGSGTLTILTINNNTGPTVVNSGTVQYGNGGSSGAPGTGNITNNSAVVFAQPDDRSVGGIITGTGSVVQQGNATLTLTKDSPYSGGTTISSGTLQVGAGTAAGSAGTGPITNAGTLIFNRSGTFTVANGIKGSGTPNPAALIKVGAGTMTLGGANTYEGNTYISNGVVKLGASEVIPDAGATTGWLILDSGATSAGTLDLNGFNETVNALSGLGGGTLGQIVNNTGTATNTLTSAGVADTTFAGNILDNTGTGGRVSLVKQGSTTLTLSGPGSTYIGGTIVQGGNLTLRSVPGAGTGSIILSNGVTLGIAGIGTANVGNNIYTAPGGLATFTCDNLASGLSGVFTSGDVFSTNSIAGSISIGAPNVKQFSNFFGTVVIQDGFQLRFSSTSLSVNGGDGATFVVGSGSTLNTRNGTGNAAGNGIYLGAVLGTGTIGGAGNADGGSTYIIGGKGVDCAFDGPISGTAPRGTSLVKSGAGTLTLNGSLSFDGATTVSNGVLALALSANLDTVTNPIAIRAGAFLDVSAMPNSTLTLGNINSQTLSGSGTLRGTLIVNNNSTVAPGDSTGVLTVTNTVSITGTFLATLNRTNTPTSSRLSASSITLNAGSTLTITNVGPGLRLGDTFQLFSGPITGTFSAINPPPLSPCLSWDFSSLYTLGRITVSGAICPPALTSALVNSNSLQLSWPSAYVGAGWFLQAQTNSYPGGLSTNWVTIAGSDATNQFFMPVSRTNGSVFYRLIYP